jgi:hypothetical protein
VRNVLESACSSDINDVATKGPSIADINSHGHFLTKVHALIVAELLRAHVAVVTQDLAEVLRWLQTREGRSTACAA